MAELHTDLSNIFQKLREETFSKTFPIDGKVFLLSLSGGADSVFLFHFLCYLKSCEQFQFEAIHFNHNLRDEESDLDELFCKDLCEQYEVKLHLEHLSISKTKNLQDDARRLRYDKLKSYLKSENCYLLTAHHLDDSLESFLIGLHQGRLDSRILSLKKVQEKHKILRPLVKLKKEEILDYLDLHSFRFRIDSSNSNIKYLRNYYRHSSLMNISEDLARIQNYLSDCESDKKQIFSGINYQSCHISSSFKILKEDLIDYSFEFRVEFFYFFIQNHFSEFMSKLDMKRVEQLLATLRFGKKTFQISKTPSHYLNIIEFSKSYELRPRLKTD
ncbi:tRNA lysidine(34) synthetase TilS [bacterium]|nr:tRNA lysidine(34) synthetase TilS [bacterium]